MPRIETALDIITNPARDAIVETLQVIPCPSNWRFRLAVNNETEKICIEIQSRRLVEAKILGRVFLSYFNEWQTQRILAARSYEELLQRLKEHPEFLETEVIVAGFNEQRPAYA